MTDAGIVYLLSTRPVHPNRADQLPADVEAGEANPWDSLGEAYLADGNRIQAIISYRRSLRLNPANDNARRILRELEADE